MWRPITLDGPRRETAGEAADAPRSRPRPLFSRRTPTSTIITWAVALAPWVAFAVGLLEGR